MLSSSSSSLSAPKLYIVRYIKQGTKPFGQYYSIVCPHTHTQILSHTKACKNYKRISNTTQKGMWYTSSKTTSNYRYKVWFVLQARFVLDNSSSDTLWYVPVSYTTQEETKDGTSISRKTFPRIWLKQEPKITILNLTKPESFNQWVLFNIQATGMWSAKHFVWWQRIRRFR